MNNILNLLLNVLYMCVVTFYSLSRMPSVELVGNKYIYTFLKQSYTNKDKILIVIYSLIKIYVVHNIIRILMINFATGLSALTQGAIRRCPKQ